MKSCVLSVVIAAALAAGAAQAADDRTPAPATAQQQAARAEIDRLVKRIEELSRQAGDDGDVRVIVRHRGDAPRALEFEDDDEDDDDMDEGDGKRKVVIRRMGPPGQEWKAPMARPGGDPEWMQGPGLGIVMSANTAASGVRIAAVTPDSPAMRAGIRSGDVVLQVDGKAIAGNSDAAVENARKLIGKLEKGQVVKLRYARQGKTYDASIRADDIHRVMAFRREDRPQAWRTEGDEPMEFKHLMPPGVEMDIDRMAVFGDCEKGKKDCGMPVMYEAFRWQGLNLASVDAGLGHYFGTDKGVLVLSSGEDMKGLQSGDVIQRVGGVGVDSPRDVMRALRDKSAGSQLKLDLMRDRRPTAVSVTVPKSRPLPFITPPPPPPAPPAPPPPMAPRAAPPAPPAMYRTPPPAPPAAPSAPAPPAAPPPPPPSS